MKTLVVIGVVVVAVYTIMMLQCCVQIGAHGRDIKTTNSHAVEGEHFHVILLKRLSRPFGRQVVFPTTHQLGLIQLL